MTPLSKLLSNLDAKRTLGSASFFLMMLVVSHALASLLSGGIASLDVSTARVMVALLMLLVSIPHAVAAAVIPDGPAREAQLVLRDLLLGTFILIIVGQGLLDLVA